MFPSPSARTNARQMANQAILANLALRFIDCGIPSSVIALKAHRNIEQRTWVARFSLGQDLLSSSLTVQLITPPSSPLGEPAKDIEVKETTEQPQPHQANLRIRHRSQLACQFIAWKSSISSSRDSGDE